MAPLSTTTTVDSEQLASLAAKGSTDALTELYEHWSDKVYRWVLTKIGGIHHTAEDVCQDVWLRVARYIRSYTHTAGTTGFTGWLFQIARNCIADTTRAATRRREVITADMLSNPHAIVEGPGALDTQFSGQLAEALTKINARRAQVINLRFFAGLTVEETAAALDVKAGVVRSLQCRALKDLRAHLGTLPVPDAEPTHVRSMRRTHTNQREVTC
jgi:RNA polymerase sigma-70 factor, ECF subfamily